MDMTQLIRRNNIFGSAPKPKNPWNVDLTSAQPEDPASSVVNQDTGEPQNTGNRFSDLYTKMQEAENGPATKQYRDFLAQDAPNEENFKPTKMQRLASILTGVGGDTKEARRILSDPYDNAMGRYKTQADKLARGAEVEEKAGANKERLMWAIMSDEAKQRETERKAKLDEATIGDLNTRHSDRVAANATRGWHFNKNALDGTSRAIRMGANGLDQSVDLGQVDETPAQKDARFINRSNKVGEGALGRNLRFFNETDPIKQADKKELADITNTNIRGRNEQTAGLKPKPKDKPIKPTEEIQARFLASQKALENDPTLASEFEKGSLLPKTSRAKAARDAQMKPTTPVAKVKMTSPDGKAYMVDSAEVDDAIKNGWKK